MLAIQVVEISWTKATRGAPWSNERVALARAFPIEPSAVACVVQHYRLDEGEGFAPKVLEREALASMPGTVGVLRIAPQRGGGFLLGILGTPKSGRPVRRAIANAVDLRPGEFARILLNARHTSYRGQHYMETAYNVCCGSEIAPDRFTSGPPDHELDLKADLF